jgi:hypothetical protein
MSVCALPRRQSLTLNARPPRRAHGRYVDRVCDLTRTARWRWRTSGGDPIVCSAVPGFGTAELAFLIRRWASLLTVWASLLGVAAPTLACTFSAQSGCCPAPCQGGDLGGSSFHVAVTCCTVAPLSARVASMDASRVRLDNHRALGSPDPIGVAAWPLVTHAFEPAGGSIPHVFFLYCDSASLTYLRTGRLRL